jgi:DNA polymerase-3 subunit epsilon
MSAQDPASPSLRDRTIFSFDIETTGLDPTADRIVQIGGVFYKGGARVGQRRLSLVNPGMPIPPSATEIHHITDADVADADEFAAVAPRFVECLLAAPDGETPVLCGYNAPGFDVPFINAELNRCGATQRIDPTRVLDPLVFVRWHHRDWRGRNLEVVAGRFGHTLSRAHSAAADAEAAAFVLWRLIEEGSVPPLLAEALATQARLAARLEDEWLRFGRVVYLDRRDGRPRMGIGVHSGKLLGEVDRDYLRWCLREMSDLTDEARSLLDGVVGGAARSTPPA